MKIAKRILIALLVLVILVVGSAIALPYFFKDEITALAKEEINKTVNAEVDFQGVSLSLLRSFPNFSLQINDFTVKGKEEFAGVELASGKSLGLTLDLMSVIRSTEPVAIRAVELLEPNIHIYVLENGKANYDIMIPSEEPAEEPAADTAYSNVVVELDEYNIVGGTLIYDDRSLEVFADARNITHSGTGNFTIDIYDLDTQTEVEKLTVSQSGITYLKDAHATLDAIFHIDQPNSKYTLKDNELLINELRLNAEGFVQLMEDDIDMDLSFNTPQNEFRHLLSMIPYAYIEGYEDVKADGQFSLRGEVKGTYNGEREEYPGFRVEASVDKGNVQYPGLPLGIKNINTLANINSPGSDFDQLTVDVPRFNMTVGNNPFQASFFLKTPVSDPNVQASAKGVINLAELAKAFPMEGIQELNGIINADMNIDTRLSYIEKEQYERVKMDGNLQVQNVKYRSEGLPAIQVNDMQMAFTPQKVRVDNFDALLGESDIKAKGSIDNILAYFSPEKTMYGTLNATSDFFNADEWMPEEEESPAAQPMASGETSSEETEVFDRFDFTMEANAKKIVYGDYTVTDGYAQGNMTPNRLRVGRLYGRIGDSDFTANGLITNLFDYLFENGVLGGEIDMSSQVLNLNQFMEEEEAAASTGAGSEAGEGYGVIPVPPNINMTVNANIDKLSYTNIDLRSVKGQAIIADEAVVLDGVTAQGLGGEMAMSGSYETKDTDNPIFRFKYDLQRLSFQEAFTKLNTFEQLAPIGKFIKGTFNSSLIMDGRLGSDLMPKLESINAQGFLETLNGVIAGFEPAQAIGNKLNIAELKQNIAIENTRNWFEINNGVLELQEYDAKVKGIDMKIGGTYSVTNKMDLDIKAQIPRKMLESTAIGAAAGSGLSLLQNQASKLGINIQQGEFINVLINLTGEVNNPNVGLKLLGMDGETTVADAAKEQVKEEAQKAVEEGKKAAEEAAKKAVDSAKTVVKEQADKAVQEAADKAKQAAKETIGGAVDSATQKKVEDVIGKEGADKIKENLDKWNPFGKKKKEEEDKKKKEGGGG